MPKVWMSEARNEVEDATLHMMKKMEGEAIDRIPKSSHSSIKGTGKAKFSINNLPKDPKGDGDLLTQPLLAIVSQIEKPVASASMFTRSIIDRGKQRFFTGL
ncbi:hypothetical protein [Geobacillus icigianus]|uniref:hypothetical protein n=1 Tax=Geobacillus TaxID=129337 RepID=UPI00103C1692|nr:hypothetical protein [Geobacillus icigianus]